MKRLLLFLVSIVAFHALSAQELPLDPSVRFGTLENGYTYYIQHSIAPPNQATFYLAQRVGSLQEQPNQRGLAHFLEHMCFNGTDHFPGNTLYEFLSRHGISHDNFNADTDINATTYYINGIPTDQGTEFLDSMLFVLRDWSHGLTLDPKEIDKERGVVLEEWRARNVGRQRMIYSSVPDVYAGSPIADFLPLGDPQIIKTFRPALLEDYYDRWYNPENQCVVVVGDFDVDRMEAQVRKMFSTLKRSKNAGTVAPAVVPDNDQPAIVIRADKEVSEEELMVFCKLPNTPREEKNTAEYRRRQIMEAMLSHIIENRFLQANAQSDTPFDGEPSVGISQFYATSFRNSVIVTGKPKEGRAKDAIRHSMTLLRQAAEHGFTPNEYGLGVQWINQLCQERLATSNRYNQVSRANSLASVYLNGGVVMEDTISVSVDNQLLETITLDDLNVYASEYFYRLDGKNLNLVFFNKQGGANDAFTQQDYQQVLREVAATKTEPYADAVSTRSLMSELPPMGEIVEVDEWKYGFTRYRLGNGMIVMAGYTDRSPQQVLMSSFAPGGAGLFPQPKPMLSMLGRNALGYSKIGGYTMNERDQILFGKNVNLDWNFEHAHTQFEGECRTYSLEDLLQLFYLTMTSAEPDDEAFEKRRESIISMLKMEKDTPDLIFQQAINRAWLNEAAQQWTNRPTTQQLQQFDYHAALNDIRSLFSDAGAYVVFIVGQYNRDDLERLIRQYLASLPGTSFERYSQNVANTVIDFALNPSQDIEVTCKMTDPQSRIHLIIAEDNLPYNVESIVKASYISHIFDIMVKQKIREEMGVSYSPNVAMTNLTLMRHVHVTGIQASIVAHPEQADQVKQTIDDLYAQLTQSCDPDLFKRAQEEMLNEFHQVVNQNGQWIYWADTFGKLEIDIPNNIEDAIKAQTPETISAYAGLLSRLGRTYHVIMRPE